MSSTWKLLPTPEALVEWVEDEGALLDEARLLSARNEAGRVVLELAAVLPAPASRDRRRAFQRKTERLRPFNLRTTGPGELRGKAQPSAVHAASLRRGRAGFGLRLERDSGSVVALGRAWQGRVGRARTAPLMPALDPRRLHFADSGPLRADRLLAALRRRGVAARLYENWDGSGQPFASAFAGPRPVPVAPRATLDRAWRLVPARARPADPRGLWLSGMAIAAGSYVTLERTGRSSPALVEAVVEALAGLPGPAWASSGNQLLEGPAALGVWVRRRP